MSAVKIYTGPKGGQYWLDENNKKHYIKKGSKPTKQTVSSITYKKVTVEVPDYEHSGDLRGYEQYIKSEYPTAINFNSWDEHDREAEADYEREYGSCDDPIYRGFVSFEIPTDDYDKVVEHLGY